MGNATPNYTNLQSKSTPKTHFFSKNTHFSHNFYPQNTHSVPKLPHTAHHVKPEIKNTPRSAGGLRSAIRGRHASNLRATSTVLRLTSNCLLHDRTLILTHRPHRVKQKKNPKFSQTYILHRNPPKNPCHPRTHLGTKIPRSGTGVYRQVTQARASGYYRKLQFTAA